MRDQPPDDLLAASPWQALRRLTPARIALGRAGDSLPTQALLSFQLDHARARDAVHLPFHASGLAAQLADAGYPVLRAASAAEGRASYLRRPDLGRRLGEAARADLAAYAADHPGGYDAVFVIAAGLSALAAHQHALPLLRLAYDALRDMGWRLAPVVVADQGRVALADEIGQILGAEQSAILIGERPGLSVADSLGVYLTYAPGPGRSDAERNCISNIHPRGLSYAEACQTLVYLMSQARRLKLTGVALKDERADHDAGAYLAE
ncbi:MAG: ethanolamine ammonia-lyase subunit EutC [Chloroflexales bacterium]|nr:ethanolamine ammonia-lyase subunit EutC [Chloroflexales bacterium]